MEFIDITRGHLRVKVKGKSITIYGEAFLKGYRSPEFVLYQKGIKKWIAPNGEKNVTFIEKEQLIQFLKEESSRRKMLLEVE